MFDYQFSLLIFVIAYPEIKKPDLVKVYFYLLGLRFFSFKMPSKIFTEKNQDANLKN